MILEHFQNLCIVTFVEHSSTTTATMENVVPGSADVVSSSAVVENVSLVVSSSAACKLFLLLYLSLGWRHTARWFQAM